MNNETTETMFKNPQEVSKLAKSMGFTIKGLEKLPEIKISNILFEDEDSDNLYQADGWNMTFAKFKNGNVCPLAKVSESYALIQHYEAIGQVLTSFKDLPEFELDTIDLSYTSDGGKCFVEFKSKNGIEILPDDIIYPRVTLSNSVDTSKRFQIQWGAMRQICTNGMMGPDNRIKGGSTRRLHKLGTLSLENEIKIFKESFQEASDSFDIWKNYAKIEMESHRVLEVFEEVGFSEKQIEKIISTPLIGEGPTLTDKLKKGKTDGWSVYNGGTQFITHSGNDNSATEIERGIKLSTIMDKFLK